MPPQLVVESNRDLRATTCFGEINRIYSAQLKWKLIFGRPPSCGPTASPCRPPIFAWSWASRAWAAWAGREVAGMGLISIGNGRHWPWWNLQTRGGNTFIDRSRVRRLLWLYGSNPFLKWLTWHPIDLSQARPWAKSIYISIHQLRPWNYMEFERIWAQVGSSKNDQSFPKKRLIYFLDTIVKP